MYNHKNKAGNCGDIVKHLVLSWVRSYVETYIDAFCGYPKYDRFSEDYDKFFECFKYSSNFVSIMRYQNCNFGEYVGSSVLMYNDGGGSKYMWLYDTNPEVVESLREFYRDRHTIEIFNRPLLSSDIVEIDADFVLFDPPGLRSDKHPEYPSVENLLSLIEVAVGISTKVMLWLPLTRKLDSDSFLPDSVCYSRNGKIIESEIIKDNLVCIRVLFNEWAKESSLAGCDVFLSVEYSEHFKVFDLLLQIGEHVGWDIELIF